MDWTRRLSIGNGSINNQAIEFSARVGAPPQLAVSQITPSLSIAFKLAAMIVSTAPHRKGILS